MEIEALSFLRKCLFPKNLIWKNTLHKMMLTFFGLECICFYHKCRNYKNVTLSEQKIWRHKKLCMWSRKIMVWQW